MSNVAIAIAGNSGSGKTTLSKMLANEMQRTVVLECDRYHKWERTDKNWETYTHLDPSANNLDSMQKDVKRLLDGKEIYQVNYDHSNGKFTERERITPEKFILVCGLHSFFFRNHDPYFLKIFMDTDEELQVAWKLNRDKKKRGYSYREAAAQIEKREKDYQKYIIPQREMADLCIRFLKNKSNKMTYSLEVEVAEKFCIERLEHYLKSKEIDFTTIRQKGRNMIFFKNYRQIKANQRYNNFYDYIVIMIKGIIDGEY